MLRGDEVFVILPPSFIHEETSLGTIAHLTHYRAANTDTYCYSSQSYSQHVYDLRPSFICLEKIGQFLSSSQNNCKFIKVPTVIVEQIRK